MVENQGLTDNTKKPTTNDTVPMVVTLSGILRVQDMEGVTADTLVSFALDHWNISREIVDRPFVAIHDKIANKNKTVEGDGLIGPLDASRQVIRVVLPLKTLVLQKEAGETRQLLMES